MTTQQKPKMDILRKTLRVHGMFGKNTEVNGSNAVELTPDEAKKRITEYADILTNQSALIDKINITISESNQYLSPISNSLIGIEKTDHVTKLAIFACFKKNAEVIEDKIDGYIQQLNQHNEELSSCTYNYTNIVREIENLQILLDPESKFFQTAVGIVSYNKLRIVEMGNKDKQITHQIDVLEQFKVSTLYHLRESIDQEFVGKDTIALIEQKLIEIKNKIAKIKSWKPRILISQVILIVLFFYNYLADKYHINFTRTVEKYNEVSNSNDGLNVMDVGQAAESLIGTITVMARLIALPLFIFGIFKVFHAVQDPERNSVSSGVFFIFVSAFINMITFILPSPNTNGTVAYIEHKTYTFDFFNLGATGSLIFLMLFVMLTALIFVNIKRVSALNTMHEKISNPFNF